MRGESESGRIGLLLKLFVVHFVMFIGVPGTAQQMKYQSASVKISTDSLNEQLISLNIRMLGRSKPLSLISLDFGGFNKQGVPVKIYYSNRKDSFSKVDLLDSFSSGVSRYKLKVPQTLIEGNNFVWIVSNADVRVQSFKIAEQLYRETWADEFNGDTVNSNNWRFEKGFIRNHEAQWYQEENARCSNGVLTIEAKRTHEKNPNYVAGSNDWRKNREFIEYTASSLNTSGKQSWQYGRFEMRARIDTVLGYWPAWWTLGVSKPWPSNGEIDIMEYYRGKVLANIAVGGNRPYNALWYSNTKAVKLFDANWKNEFHIWRMDWDENGIGLYLDGDLMNYQPQANLYNRDGSGSYPFKQKHYMLLNLAIGGDNGGNPSATPFPLKYEIDYVRVSQKKDGSYKHVQSFKPKQAGDEHR